MSSTHAHQDSPYSNGFGLTRHAKTRMDSRRISDDAVLAVLNFGRIVHIPGAVVYFVGRREVSKYARQRIDLSGYEGIQVICSLDGAIVTVFRCNDLKWLRSRQRVRYFKAS
ncbi:DUF4258 domain-containing protein [Candidatus Eisenbacteria bacterium]|uniref:DUF4258 domain-containing protein n=1 Tax=Eiseniibacteriota bacterium TaxID=2212470 RepID=A0ABV6YK17_UNCEI